MSEINERMFGDFGEKMAKIKAKYKKNMPKFVELCNKPTKDIIAICERYLKDKCPNSYLLDATRKEGSIKTFNIRYSSNVNNKWEPYDIIYSIAYYDNLELKINPCGVTIFEQMQHCAGLETHKEDFDTFESIYNYIIFNNGSGSQTQDLCLDGVTSENPLWNGSTWVALDRTAPETPNTPSTESTALYLLPHNDWKSDGATFVAYIWNNTGSTWCGLEDTNADGIYEMTLPEGYTNIIFIRMNPSATEYNWTYVWNQTVDLTVPTNGDNLFTIENPWNSASEYKGTGSWSRL